MKKVFRTTAKNLDWFLSPMRKPNIVFIHVPKCGGSSISSAIRKSYGFWNCVRLKYSAGLDPQASLKTSKLSGVPLFELRKIILIYYLNQATIKFVSGH